MKRTLLALGTIAAVATPVAGVVACGTSSNKDETFKGSLGDKKLKILTLGDSVAHGDYTFQMSGSGTGFTPLLDGPARAASYQDYLFDEFQRDGLMDENDKPDYKTSASGLRSGELAQWIKRGSYLKGMKADNPEVGTDKEAAAAKEHVDYHRHPYTNNSGDKTWWDDGVGKPVTVQHKTVASEQKDMSSMTKHVKESNVVLITIGGNDILKDIMVMGTPFPSLGTINFKTVLPTLLGGMMSNAELMSQPHIKGFLTSIATKLNDDTFKKKASGLLSTLKSQAMGILTGSVNPSAIFGEVVSTLGPLLTGIASIPSDERLVFDKWFLGDGHKSLITVDQTLLKESLAKFTKNIDIISNQIHKINPDAKVIFTGYPSPMMHFPKIFRNLAMPIYGQIAKLTQAYADKAEGVYYAPSSLQNWETDDATDIYDNIMVDPHPTLQGQGIMAQDILKVIDEIYGLKAKLTTEELDAKTADEVESHKLSAPKMTPSKQAKELETGTYQIPYQTNTDPKFNGDLDYAYNVKPIVLEELTHAKVYFTSRIATFLIDAITDSIKLNPEVKNPGDQSVPHEGALTLSDFTKNWGDEYLDYLKDNAAKRFIEPFGEGFTTNVSKEFLTSLQAFAKTFAAKLEGTISSDDRVVKAKALLAKFTQQ